jgi:predicted nucleic acid-binding protein
VTVTDAGPLIALIDADEPDHERCREALDQLRLPLLTTWPAFTEAMYLLGRAAGWNGQSALWRLLSRGDVAVAAPTDAANGRAARLMETYADRPMDLADATLVALAEERDTNRVFTLDGDFHVYRFKGRRRFDVIPA